MSQNLEFPKNVFPFEGEYILASYWANRTQNRWMNSGGTLYLSSHRILFSPNLINANLGGRKWWALREDVTGADIVRQNLADLFSGGLRKRLKIDLRDGPAQLFIVPEPALVAKDIRSWTSPEIGS
ncbi:hypothetical protein GCM10027563_08950 [Parasphingorhabdus pacifica]